MTCTPTGGLGSEQWWHPMGTAWEWVWSLCSHVLNIRECCHFVVAHATATIVCDSSYFTALTKNCNFKQFAVFGSGHVCFCVNSASCYLHSINETATLPENSMPTWPFGGTASRSVSDKLETSIHCALLESAILAQTRAGKPWFMLIYYILVSPFKTTIYTVGLSRLFLSVKLECSKVGHWRVRVGQRDICRQDGTCPA